MEWSSYCDWQSQDPQHRPEVSLADGYLAGAVVSLQEKSDDLWIADILGDASTWSRDRTVEPDERSKARDVLKVRLAEAREQLASSQTSYAPVLSVSPEGEFDVAAWATGFVEATGPDLEIWLYHLAGTREAGLFGVLGAHAAGPIGDAARSLLSSHAKAADLASLKDQAWEYIGQFVAALYARRSALGMLAA
ncbi:UPF0149 family protein [Novosphingobium sp. HII-3]|uniref:UPF0149 family protein n=1 Tax=Novosphingobium sp. HII-3 TaxID=2075565 RepID=UPI000CDB8315|nr:UPF0149 family protein [Novosphingobium sp. HII-3]